MSISYTKLRGCDAVRAAANNSRFVACFTTTGDDGYGYSLDGAIAWGRVHHGRRLLLADGEPAAAAALVEAVLRDEPPQRMMMSREIMLRLPESLRPARVGEWRWFYTDTPPEPVPGEERVTWLRNDEAGRAGIERLLDEAFADASTRTADEQVKAWFGVYGEDGVTPIGCGAVSGPAPDVPFLASVTVHPSARRQGLASAMTAWVTRTLLAAGHPFVSLGSMEGEDATHRLYRRLGYRDTHALMSGSVETVTA
ncbi:GNAT family N-acetyltransferase [Phytomonospora endophytica]|uniref:GNAT superfamily N-acetyltransferase n=1 Tax=Phytomonospora endophytica TaxID=714109 RepID=A0A841FL92_9ACTN|nr:GNAT family N-acetyltransferase [Phytomonospora endophytica]MBB6032720.1 GNAT superfamily N-acetyltransferase [Phytomonospora endophytica]GIG66131.1 hypothetical protein Pen01_24260 [Phytomonospora endophytica]